MHPADGRVVSNFIMQAIRGEPITIYGNGRTDASFCFVSDLVDGFIRFMGKDGFAGPVNLGNPNEFTMLDLAETIIRLTASRSKLEFKPLPQDDPMQRQPDISLAQNEFGWTPRVQLQEGLQRTIEYFRGL
jgi:UDP-glucuronate decarboxylase